jgi:hypothetical protein
MELSRYCSPAMEHRARWRIARCASCSVAIQPLEIENSCPESEDPALERAAGDTHASRNARQRHSIGERLADRFHNNLDTSDLARQRIARQHALAMPAATTARQRHGERYECLASLEPSFDPTASQSESALVTGGAPAAREELIAGTVDERSVAARLNIEYENHVLMTVPG